MQNVQVENTRNFALIGHSGDGKTSLGESLLHRAGVTQDLGHVDDGSSVLNYLPEERDGHIASISSHLYAFDWHNTHFTMVDTPGDPNFQGDGQVALQALDAAVLVVSAVDGAKGGTEKMLHAAQSQDMPVIAFINGLDRDRADFEAAVESLAALEETPVVVAFPIGTSEALSGVVDLLSMRAITNDGTQEIPEALKAEAETRREALIEAIAECDDTLLEKYLEEGELNDEEILLGLHVGARSHQILPVLCGSATNEIGVDLMLRELIDLMPSPTERGEWIGVDVEGDHEEHEVAPDADAPFSAIVFKTIIDRYAGTLSVFRVVSGTLHSDQSILNATSGARLRVGKLFALQGDKHVDVSEAGPGDVVAVAKLKDVHTGNVLTADKGGVHLPEPELPAGVLSYAIDAADRQDEDKLYTALGKLVEEDPTLRLDREPSTGELLLSGMGELHIRTTVKKLRRVADLDIQLRTPQVPYRETIAGAAKHVEGKLKKQSGGAGMFGVCYVDIEPLGRGEGVQFDNKVVGGAIPKNLIPAVEKGVIEACQRGPLAGFPVVDVKVTCVDGKHHSVDSNEMAFKLAGSFALKAAVEQAKPTLLEPVMKVEITVPDECVGDVMGDLSSRRGLVQTTSAKSHASVVVAKVPMAEMLEYASILTSMTSGKGEFHLEYSHYEEVPAKLRKKIVEDAKPAE